MTITDFVFMLAIYFVMWWLTLFAVLPFGVRTQAEEGDVVPGTPASAPANFRFWRVIGITTLTSALILMALWSAVHWGLIDLSVSHEPIG